MDWLFAVYAGIELEVVYLMTPAMIEPWYKKWEKEFKTKGPLNNPKIGLNFVQEKGILLYENKQVSQTGNDNVGSA